MNTYISLLVQEYFTDFKQNKHYIVLIYAYNCIWR